MGISIYAQLSFGIPIEEDEIPYGSFWYTEKDEDGKAILYEYTFEEWVWDCNIPIELVRVGSCDCNTYILALKYIDVSWDYKPVNIETDLLLTEEEVEIFKITMKAFCRYIGIEYQEPKWYLSALMS